MSNHNSRIILSEDQARSAGVPLPARMEAQREYCPVPLDYQGTVTLKREGHKRYALEGKLARMHAMYDVKRALSAPPHTLKVTAVHPCKGTPEE